MSSPENDKIPDCPNCEKKLTEMDAPNHFICVACESLYKRDEETGELRKI